MILIYSRRWYGHEVPILSKRWFAVRTVLMSLHITLRCQETTDRTRHLRVLCLAQFLFLRLYHKSLLFVCWWWRVLLFTATRLLVLRHIFYQAHFATDSARLCYAVLVSAVLVVAVVYPFNSVCTELLELYLCFPDCLQQRAVARPVVVEEIGVKRVQLLLVETLCHIGHLFRAVWQSGERLNVC